MPLIQKVVTYSRLWSCLIVLAAVLPKSTQSLPFSIQEEAASTIEWKFAARQLGIPSQFAAGKSLIRTNSLDELLAKMHEQGDRYTRGVYVPGEFAFPIVQQPDEENLYVSSKRNLVTAFQAAEQNGVTGLLAHNFLAGAFFYDLEIGQEIWVVESEQKLRGYQITKIEQFQKIEDDENDIFVDLETNHEMNGSEVFDRFYTGEPHLILQTCLEGEGDPSWGLTFIVAEPIP